MPDKKQRSAVYFISGSDEAEVKTKAAALAVELAPGADAFSLEKIDGSTETVDAALGKIHETCQALQTLPFLGSAKLIWLKSATFFADSVMSRSESVLDALAHLCAVVEAGLPDGITLLVSAPEADKRRAAYKSFLKFGISSIHDRPEIRFGGSEDEVITWIASRVRDRGLTCSPQALEALASRVGLDTRRLNTELDKLETSFGVSHTIELVDVCALVPATRESGIFDVANAISARDLPLALETLDQLFRQGERGVGILLAAIMPTIRNLLFVKDLLRKHKLQASAQMNSFTAALNRLDPEEIDHLPRKKDGTLNTYPLYLAARSASHFTSTELRRAFRQCADANLQFVTSQTSESVILSRLLVGLMGR